LLGAPRQTWWPPVPGRGRQGLRHPQYPRDHRTGRHRWRHYLGPGRYQRLLAGGHQDRNRRAGRREVDPALGRSGEI